MSASDLKARLPFLLEIGSEEIPARFIPPALAELDRMFRAELEEAHLACEGGGDLYLTRFGWPRLLFCSSVLRNCTAC